MEETKLDKTYNAVRILIKEQKVQSIKITEMEKKLNLNEKFICKLEKALNEEKKETDKRFDTAIDRFENLDTIVEEHTETVDEIEEKACDLKKKIDLVNESLEKINLEIAELEKKNINEDNKVAVDCDAIDKNDDRAEIRQCRFDRVGYCYKGKDECEFLHVEETCEIYSQSGYCNKVKCIRRHPRKCFYYEGGFCRRSDDCRYLHRTTKATRQCKKCNQRSNLTYYCEFCDESYCSKCTVKEAHDNNFIKSNILAECMNVHI